MTMMHIYTCNMYIIYIYVYILCLTDRLAERERERDTSVLQLTRILLLNHIVMHKYIFASHVLTMMFA